PLTVALVPVIRASRITIHEAFSNGLGRKPFGTRRFDHWLARMQWLPRPLMLSLRTTFHRRGRLILTVSTLAAGGAVFIAALNVSAGWSRIISNDAAAHRYDFEVVFARPQPIGRVQSVVRGEAWNETKVDGIPVIAVPPNTPLLRLKIVEGRWLRDDDRDAIVITQQVRGHRVGSRIGRWTVVGVAEEWGLQTIYTTPRALPSNGMTRTLRIATRSDAPAIERAFARAGIAVAHMQSLADRRKGIADHLVIIESALLFAALLVVLVGALGLMSTLTLNVVERTREIGILSAIGATPRTIARHVVIEGVLIGVLSWFVAVVVAAPATLALDQGSGRMFHGSPLVFVMSPAALAAWLALVLVLAALSSFVPARRSAQMVVREAISHE
ncbi:MAG TPA: FtsX-like permease family protein, partial [Thermoanaerobaculia bacterium]|nr:FtsX-like permease family protein [Thermoanaerobaculia bacterium]